MRIVAGLLALYVHISYSIDLNAFFGRDAWYSRALAERSYREYPIFVPSMEWEPKTERFPMPSHRVLRETVREFVGNVNKQPDGDRVYYFLMDWPEGEGRRAEVIRYLQRLSTDPIERDTELAKMVLAKADDEATRLALPAWLVEAPQGVRERRRADIKLL